MTKHTRERNQEKHRVIVVVLDGAGAGALPDADKYGDSGSSTLYNVIKKHAPLQLENLASLGLGEIIGFDLSRSRTPERNACFGRMAPLSPGKDTTSGHWELAGLVLEEAFPLFPDGFPPPLISAFETSIGRGSLGNFAASGTEIIEQLGPKHLETGYPIVYTSADSVFQIAAHEDIVPRDLLYDWCKKARVLLTGKYAVGRVIARPFIGKPGSFTRTTGRHDYSLEPPGKTLLDGVYEASLNVSVIGKVKDIFAGRGITEHLPGGDNTEIAESLLQAIKKGNNGLLWATFIDFDMIYGHRNDSEGFARALERFDRNLAEILNDMGDTDLLFITADHGCDPTFHTTDHTREYVPIIAWNKNFRKPIKLGNRDSYADMAATAAEWLKISFISPGTSFIPD